MRRRLRVYHIGRLRHIDISANIIIIIDDADRPGATDEVHEGEPALAQLFDDIEDASAYGYLPPDEMWTKSEAVVDVFDAASSDHDVVTYTHSMVTTYYYLLTYLESIITREGNPKKIVLCTLFGSALWSVRV